LKDNHNIGSGLKKNVEEGQAIRLKIKKNRQAMGSRYFFGEYFISENFFGKYFFG
jgi:hypothetical protein